MRVVVPFTSLHPNTLADIEAYCPQAELVDVSHSEEAYHELLCRLWEAGESFMLLEHDMGLRAGVVDELAACPNGWCGFTYPIGVSRELVVALGCTRFDAAVIAATPTLPRLLAEAQGHAGVPRRGWRALDARLDALLRTMLGRPVHRHGPPLPHYHAY